MSTYSSNLPNIDLSSILQSFVAVWTVGWQLVISTTSPRLLLCRIEFRAFPVTVPEMMTAFLNS